MSESGRAAVPVRPRSLLVLGLLALLVPATITVLATQGADRALRERVADSRMRFANTVASQLELEFRLAVDGATVAARRPTAQAALGTRDREAARRMLENVYATPPFYDGLALLDLDGQALASVPEDAAERLADWLSAPQPGARELHLLESGSNLIVREPVVDTRGRRIGTLLASISLPKLLSEIDQIRFGATGHATLLHRDGRVLASSDPGRPVRSLDAPGLRAALDAGRNGIIEYHDADLDRPEFSALVHLRNWPLAVSISQSRAEAFEPVRLMQRGVTYAMAALGLLGLLTAWYGGRAFLSYERGLQRSREVIAEQARTTGEALALREAILTSANNAIIVVDTAGVIRSVNPTTLRWLGYSQAEMIGRLTPFDLHPPAQVDAVRAQLAARLAIAPETLRYEHFVREARAGLPQEVDREFLRKDGSTFPVHLSLTALRDPDGSITGYLAVATDIGDLKAAERAVRDSERRFRTLFESAPIGIFLMDQAGDMQVLNAYYQSLTGLDVPTLVARGWTAAIHPEDLEKVRGAARDAFTSRSRYEGECRVVHRDGGVAWTHNLAVPLHDEEGHFVGYMGTTLDITARKRIEQMKSEFIATVSHELRTPLTSIRGSLGLLVGGVAGGLPPQAEQLVRIAHNNSERLVRLINDILDIERIEAGRMDFQLESLDLASVVESAVISNRGFAEQYGVHYNFEPEQATARVVADRDRLIQALTNLLSNATKYAPRDSLVEVRILVDARKARVAITDRGRGVPESFRSRIFSKFAQADGSDTREKGGSGLGLSITKAIVEGLGGHIGFDSRPGETTFWIDLPRADAFLSGDGTRPRVLIIEDDADIAHLMQLMINEAGCDADVAPDAVTAKRMLLARRYSAATVDLLLPDQDGLALVHELRATRQHADLPLIVVSAFADQRRRQLDGGAVPVLDWLNKPIDRERLLSDVLHAVRLRGMERPRILHIEDDADLVAVIGRMLGEDLDVVHAPDLATAREALALGPWALVMLDVGLPDGSGLDLLPEIQSRHPSLPVVIFSAQTVDGDIARRVAAVLGKTNLDDRRFVTTLRSLIEEGTYHAP